MIEDWDMNAGLAEYRQSCEEVDEELLQENISRLMRRKA